jgi:hypothetical protein
MIKLVSKCVLAAAVASFALAGTTTLSHATKKKAKAAPAAATCVPPKYTTTTCTNNVCRMAWCGLDGKWHPSLFVCAQPFCPRG